MISSTQVTDAGLLTLQSMPNLQWLEIDRTQISDVGLRYLRDFARLRHLSLRDTRVSVAAIDALEGVLPALEIYAEPRKEPRAAGHNDSEFHAQ